MWDWVLRCCAMSRFVRKWRRAFGTTTPEGGRIPVRADNKLSLPILRVLSRGAGALLAVCACAAVGIIVLALTSNERAAVSLPGLAPLLWSIAALAVLQIVCGLLVFYVFMSARRRFAARLRAAAGSLDDQVFLTGADGKQFAVLKNASWAEQPTASWHDAIHPDDRKLWPVEAAEPQRIELRLKQPDGNWRWHRLRATPRLRPDGSVKEWVGTLHDIHEQKLASEHRELVIGELRHRLKNLLTVIDALAKNSRKPDADEQGVEAFLQRFLGRLRALGAAGDLVLAGNRISVEMKSLFKSTLAPFSSDASPRIEIDGPRVLLSEETGAGLGLAIHELATNALKYGALSVPEGRVSLHWTLATEGGDHNLALEWKELGGPAPQAPEKPGFGTRMIKYVAAREKRGEVAITYPEDGLSCRISFAIEMPEIASLENA